MFYQTPPHRKGVDAGAGTSTSGHAVTSNVAKMHSLVAGAKFGPFPAKIHALIGALWGHSVPVDDLHSVLVFPGLLNCLGNFPSSVHPALVIRLDISGITEQEAPQATA